MGIYLKILKRLICKDICTPVFIAAYSWWPRCGDNQCPLRDDWIKKMWSMQTKEYYSAIREEKILPFSTTRMDLENIMLSRVSQLDKVKNHMIELIYGTQN